jgi:RsiW-degrading membrane proteinase PrsW (M82 family)
VTAVFLALLPVLLFLVTLLLMDSFKLVRPGAVWIAISAGAAAALVCLLLHAWLLQGGVRLSALRQYIAPAVEETAKAAFIILLIERGRVGFAVDAAIQGFAVGTGFALVENTLYLREMPHAHALLWMIRGLGTAILHGATTAIFAMIAKGLVDRHPDRFLRGFATAWIVAVAIHAAFNSPLLPPVAAMLLLLTVLPILTLWVFHRSEQATREWIGGGLDLDLELLALVMSEHFPSTQLGGFLRRFRSRFDGPVVADMFCLLRLELELSVQAKAMLVARAAGLRVPVDDDLRACLGELEYLRASIGPTGLLALKPLQVTSLRDDWHRYLLEQS